MEENTTKRFELIKINQSEKGNKTVSARELHEFLKSKQDFSTWIKKRIKAYGFIEGRDFTLHRLMERKVWKHEYVISINMAKELAMVEKTEAGRSIRNYFIEVEKHYQEIATPKQITELSNRLKKVEEKQINFINDWSVDRFLRTNGVFKKLTVTERQQLGKLCTKEYKKITGNLPKKVQHPSYVNGQNVYPYELISKMYSSKF
ncbi:antA/AntB antirepressor family protein [Chishuiella changwenlii]|nr:antA/AntB antirepressor family protein [Chishuiella changwenlii]